MGGVVDYQNPEGKGRVHIAASNPKPKSRLLAGISCHLLVHTARYKRVHGSKQLGQVRHK